VYSQLSSNQQSALETGKCPHCQSEGTMRKVWTRNGQSVCCSSCGKKVYKPRGRAVANATRQTSGGQADDLQQSGSGSQQSSEQSQQTDGNGTPPKSGDVSQKPQSQSQQQSSQVSKQVEQAAQKPLTEAAKQALAQIQSALRQEMQQQLDKALADVAKEKQQAQQDLQQQVADQVESLRPTEVIVKTQDATGQEQTQTVPNAHKLLPEILRRYAAGIRNFLFVGPSGSGKSTLARQIALALNVPYGMLPWSGDTTPGTVLGRPSPDGTSFNPSPWLQLYTQAAVFNHDELDGADPNVPICMNAAIENGEVFLPSGHFIRHAQHVVIATANTWGIGADMLYCGRNQLDAAVRDRFVGGAFIVEYDAQLEQQLAPEQEYRQTFWEIRSRIFEHKLRRVWGTRTLVRGALLVRHGYSLGETFKALTVGFSQDELQKCGVA